MTDVRQLAHGEWALYRDIRLAALKDAPYAFGSNYDREIAFPESKWRQRAEEGAAGAESTCIVALDGSAGVGIAGGITVPDQSRVGQLVSMWVHPDHRGTDVAARLVAFVEVWAFDRGFERLICGVTGGNDRAARFYARLGFVPTGATLAGHDDCLTVLAKSLAVT